MRYYGIPEYRSNVRDGSVRMCRGVLAHAWRTGRLNSGRLPTDRKTKSGKYIKMLVLMKIQQFEDGCHISSSYKMQNSGGNIKDTSSRNYKMMLKSSNVGIIE